MLILISNKTSGSSILFLRSLAKLDTNLVYEIPLFVGRDPSE